VSHSRIRQSRLVTSVARRKLRAWAFGLGALFLVSCAGEAAEEARGIAVAQGVGPGTAVGMTADELTVARPSVRRESDGVVEDLPGGRHATYFFARLPVGSTLRATPCWGCRVRAVVLEYDAPPRDSLEYQTRRTQLRDEWARALGSPDSSRLSLGGGSGGAKMSFDWLEWRSAHAGVGLLSLPAQGENDTTLVNLPLRVVMFDRRVDPRSVWTAN
jgi:hypothetical protein